jgi:hypothetical protein
MRSIPYPASQYVQHSRLEVRSALGYMNRVMRGLGIAVLFVAGCQVDDVAVSEVQSDIEAAQGCSLQGSTFNGTQLQGCSLQGCSLQGATLGSVALSGAQVFGTAIYTWQWRSDLNEWEQRWPDKICYWNNLKTQQLSCTSASPGAPLVGTAFQASFTDHDGVTRTRSLQIYGAARDTTTAMFALNGSYAQNNGCGLDSNGNRINCDIWLYDVRLPNDLDASGNPITFCPVGESAMALSGTWSTSGTFATSSTQFTLACTNGTISKCTRWGYRPWDSALKSDGTTFSALGPYHQSCVRAAMADYCANGTSFTQNGTAIDIYDITASIPASPGFIGQTIAKSKHAFAWESMFDNAGAVSVDHTRYPMIPSLSDPNQACPGHFTENDQTSPPTWNRANPSTTQGPVVWVASAPSCAHSEWMRGRFINQGCNGNCYFADVMPSCFRPTGSWTQTCVDYATQHCSVANHMTPHSECTTGVALPKYGSQCTLILSADSSLAKCFATGWDSDCVIAANHRCSGGTASPPWTGFCGTSLGIAL